MSGAPVSFWWVRHAPTDAAPGEIVGRLDHPCAAIDTTAAAALARVLPAGAPVVTSGLARCLTTARALGLTPEHTDPAFLEQDFGAWQGRTWETVEAGAFWDNPAETAPPDGESFADQVARVGPAVRSWQRTIGSGDLVCVAHAGTIRAALACALELPPAMALRFVVEPLSLTRIDVFADGAAAVRLVNWRPAP